MGLKVSLFLTIIPCICPIFFLSFPKNEIFDADFAVTLQIRTFIFSTHLFHIYCGIVILPYLAYTSCIYLIFIRSSILRIKPFFSKSSMQSLQVRVDLFGMHVDKSLYGGIENQPSSAPSTLNFTS